MDLLNQTQNIILSYMLIEHIFYSLKVHSNSITSCFNTDLYYYIYIICAESNLRPKLGVFSNIAAILMSQLY